MAPPYIASFLEKEEFSIEREPEERYSAPPLPAGRQGRGGEAGGPWAVGGGGRGEAGGRCRRGGRRGEAARRVRAAVPCVRAQLWRQLQRNAPALGTWPQHGWAMPAHPDPHPAVQGCPTPPHTSAPPAPASLRGQLTLGAVLPQRGEVELHRGVWVAHRQRGALVGGVAGEVAVPDLHGGALRYRNAWVD